MGRVGKVLNCSAPDTGNMKSIELHGHRGADQQLETLLRGEIRSGFPVTEPAAASSDDANI
jgi:acyl-CoA dehydrogenase